MANKKLGRGLVSLFGGNEDLNLDNFFDDKDRLISIKIEDIKPMESQPRKYFDDESLKELAESLREHGLIQPIIVKKNGDVYEIIAGERRYRAAKMAGLKEIPAIIRVYDEDDIDKLQLIENIQREDLNPVDEALAYLNLKNKYKLKQEDIAKAVSKSRPYISNMTRMLSLEEEILDMLRKGELTRSHAKVLLSVEDKNERLKLARNIKEKNMTVDMSEKRAKKPKSSSGKKESKDSKIRDIEDRLRERFGTKIKLSDNMKRGKIEIEYYSSEDLSRILDILLSWEG